MICHGLGVPEKYDHPDFLNAVELIIGNARSMGDWAQVYISRGSNEEHKRLLLDMGQILSTRLT